MAKVCWFCFVEEERNGDRVYTFQKRGAGIFWNVNSFVRGLGGRDKIALVYDLAAKRYRLPQKLDAHILKYGTFSS